MFITDTICGMPRDEAPQKLREAFEVVKKRAYAAYEKSQEKMVQTRGGLYNPKTKKDTQKDLAIFEEYTIILDRAFDWMGSSYTGIYFYIRDEVDARLKTKV